MPQSSLTRVRTELSGFLRSRRERLSPEDVGLPASGRRRTPGLRREEVAAIAGVGLTWYTWFEQGREIGVSDGFLDNLARALRLDATERAHLFQLATGAVPTPLPPRQKVISPILQRFLDGLGTRPAFIRNQYWDVIAWNEAANIAFGYGDRTPEQRNVLWLVFTNPDARRMMVNWEEDAPRVLAKFRTDFARHAQDPAMLDLIARMKASSTDFRRLWGRHDVMGGGEGVKQIDVPSIGPVSFEYAGFGVGEDPDLRLSTYAPLPGDRNGEAFERMMALRLACQGSEVDTPAHTGSRSNREDHQPELRN